MYSYNHSCHGKAISITFSQCVFVALGIQHAVYMWPVRLYNIFAHYLINSTVLKKK